MTIEEETFRSPQGVSRRSVLGVERYDGTKVLTEQIKEMAAEGWGAFFMHSPYGLAVEYLSEEWVEGQGSTEFSVGSSAGTAPP